MTYDIAIIGGGIVGAATFYKLQQKFPNQTIVLLEKMDQLADHQTGQQTDRRNPLFRTQQRQRGGARNVDDQNPMLPRRAIAGTADHRAFFGENRGSHPHQHDRHDHRGNDKSRCRDHYVFAIQHHRNRAYRQGRDGARRAAHLMPPRNEHDLWNHGKARCRFS